MKANIIKRVLTGALALSLVLAPSVGALAVSTNGTVNGTTAGAGGGSTYVAVTEAFPNAKSTFTAAGYKSTIGGAFILEKGFGLATTTDSSVIAANFGLTGGARPYVKAYDFDASKSTAAKAVLDATAVRIAPGAKVLGYLNFELGMMQSGRYSLLTGPFGVNVALSVPSKLFNAGARYAVVSVQEGGIVGVYADATPNDSAITVTLPAGRCALALVQY